ncbi:Nuclear pore assembly and biogenesis protein APQ12 [Penicillium bovifimosum]|uniref:Nuclear pore assembly and biogenesis protein APQ12 n=1 Tax=Penicillium bovifimosum TaxID=126998 RepID=A0A9W9H1L1_9EURO|nr:Nuclear pore assembly and biogenesis protein APQ12 [Penicillium bovifimosum]KAJ5135785.1 Nuclear pore assembly and biogenesis protein APQ12 [Penicillium bovifimosum]
MATENFQTLLQNPTVAYLQSTTQDHLTSKLTHLRTMVLQPYLIEPMSTFLTTYTGAMPDLLSLFMLAIILLISIKVVNYAFRVVMFWVSLAFRLVFWGSLLGAGWYVYSVGVENAGRDLGWIYGVVVGLLGEFQEKSKTAAAAYAKGPK